MVTQKTYIIDSSDNPQITIGEDGSLLIHCADLAQGRVLAICLSPTLFDAVRNTIDSAGEAGTGHSPPSPLA